MSEPVKVRFRRNPQTGTVAVSVNASTYGGFGWVLLPRVGWYKTEEIHDWVETEVEVTFPEREWRPGDVVEVAQLSPHYEEARPVRYIRTQNSWYNPNDGFINHLGNPKFVGRLEDLLHG